MQSSTQHTASTQRGKASPRSSAVPRSRRSRQCMCVLVSLAAMSLVACKPETKVVNYKPFFTGLENAQHGEAPVVGQRSKGLDPRAGAAAPRADGGEFDAGRNEVVYPDGTVTLVMRTPGQLMAQIERLMAEEDEVLFAEQVLSAATRADFAARGVEPTQALAMIHERRADVRRLFRQLPLAENTPQAIYEVIGPNIFRLRVTGTAARAIAIAAEDSKAKLKPWMGLDVVLEADGNYRLRWFF
jgi:hypothetical protein